MSDQPFIGLHHCAVRTEDLEATVAFFEKLGYRQVHEWHLPEYLIEKAVMMQAPNNASWLELFDIDAQIPAQGTLARAEENVTTGALAHLCLTVDDLAEASQKISDAGARLLYGPEKLELGTPSVQVENALFEGPGGIVIELLQQVGFPGDRQRLAQD